MSRKHFEALAHELRRVRPAGRDDLENEQWIECCKAVATACRSVAPTFDREKFLKACGFPGELSL